MGFDNSETAEMLKLPSWQVGAEICLAGSTGQEAEPRNSEDPSLQYVQAHPLAGRVSHGPRGALASLPDTNGASSGRYLRLLQEGSTIDFLAAVAWIWNSGCGTGRPGCTDSWFYCL